MGCTLITILVVVPNIAVLLRVGEEVHVNVILRQHVSDISGGSCTIFWLKFPAKFVLYSIGLK